MEPYNSNQCRICMKADGFISVFDKLNDKQIAQLIFETFNVKIEDSQHVKAPSKCCGNCLQNLMAAVDLKRCCLASNQVISEYFILPAERTSAVVEKVTIIEPKDTHQEPKEFHIKIESPQNIHESEDFDFNDEDSQDFNIPADHTNTAFKETEPDIPNPSRKKTKTAPSETDVPTKCRFCSKEFISQKRAMIHEEKLHLLEKDFICDLCGRAYIYKSMVETHIKKFHLKIKNFSCEICGFAMYSKADYTNHRKTHDPDTLKDFSCEICGKKFTKRYNLTCHTRSHTKEKTFCCHICSERFVHKSTYRRHLAKHNREYKFNCGVCSKQFYNRNTMLTHELRHNKVKKPRKSRRKVKDN